MIYNSKKIRQVLKEINILSQDKLINEAIAAYRSLLQDLEKEHNDQCAEVYLKFAKFLFLNENRQSCISNLKQAQKAGCELHRITNFISTFSGNEEIDREKEFYDSYIANNHSVKLPSFDDLQLSFLKAENDSYTGFDHELGFFELNSEKKMEVDFSSQFSDYLLVEPWNFMNIASLIDQASQKGKHCYIISGQPERLLSFTKLEKLRPLFNHITVFKNADEFENYMLDTGKYLSWNIVAKSKDEIESCRNLVTKIHKKRLLPEFRKGNNILLSICIPSFNRGHRALEETIHTLKTHFDEEIEVIVSNNCSGAFTEQYQQISEIKDSRLRYWCNKENTFLVGNLVKVIHESHGKYVIIMSDEDYLCLDKVDLLLNYLKNKGEGLAWLRPSYGENTKFEDCSYSRGTEALSHALFKNNYLTGIIYNKEMLLESGGLQYLQDNSQQAACSIYPHMVLDIFGATSGRCEFSSMIITIQGKDENNYTEKMQQDFYQNTDRRNQQNQGFFLVIVEIIKKHKLPLNLAIHLLMKLTNKTYCLLMQNSFINGDYSREKRMAFNGGVKKLHNETKENLAVLSEIYVKNLLGDEQEKLKKDLDDILNTAFTKHFVTINPNVSLSSR